MSKTPRKGANFGFNLRVCQSRRKLIAADGWRDLQLSLFAAMCSRDRAPLSARIIREKAR